MNEPTSHLGRLLDEATAHYQPQPDVARFERMLVVQHRRRAGVVVWSAAACFALIGGTAFAFNQQTDDNVRLAPAHEGYGDHPESTTVKTTEHRTGTTLPDGGHEPTDKTTLPTQPLVTEPPATEPTTTEKKKETHNTQPHTTEPHTTEPPASEPPNTEPHNTEPGTTTTTVHYEWSVHQVKGSTDAEPPTEVFYGTGDPNEKITIESPYGYIQFYPNDNGQWEAHITFTNPPVGVAFPVYVHSASHVASFYFTYLG